MNREIDDIDIGLIEVAENAAQGGDVAVGGDLQARRVLVGHRHPQRVGGHELRVGVGEADVDAAAGNSLLELLRAALGDQASAVEDRHPVGEPVGLLEVLRGEEHGGAVVGQALDDLPHGATAARIKAGGRLVEEDDLRRADQRHRQVEPATHPARVGHRDPVGGIGQLEPLEQLADALARSRAREVVQVGHQRQVLAPGEQLVDRPRTDRSRRSRRAPRRPRARRRVRRRGSSPWSASSRVARIRTIVVLPAPLGPNSANTLPCSTVEVESVEDDVVAEGLAHIDGGDGR